MPLFSYKALDASGKAIKGKLDAESVQAAKRELKKSGYFVTSLKETTVRQHRFKLPGFSLVRGENIAFLASLTRQLSTLLAAGLPLLRALTAILDQMEAGHTMDVLNTVRDRIREGETLARALGDFPELFPTFMVNMISAGETSGALDITMARLADYYEGRVALRHRLRATLAYPIFMVLVGSGVLFFLFIFLIPRVTAIFDEMETALPLSTRMLISLSNAVQSYWYVGPLLLVSILLAIRQIKAREHLMVRIDEWMLHVPVLGELVLKLSAARLARTLGTLLAGGVSLFQALAIVKTILTNRYLGNIIEEVRVRVGEGESLTKLLKEQKVFPPVFLHMVGVGEETGQLEQMMLRVAETYENEVDQAVTAMTSLLEPVMILALGVVVGMVVISILLPIFEMSHIIR